MEVKVAALEEAPEPDPEPAPEPDPKVADAPPALTIVTLVAYVTIVVTDAAVPVAEEAAPEACEDAAPPIAEVADPSFCDEPACEASDDEGPKGTAATVWKSRSQQRSGTKPNGVGNGLGLTHRA